MVAISTYTVTYGAIHFDGTIHWDGKVPYLIQVFR